MTNIATSSLPITSAPALAAALRAPDSMQFALLQPPPYERNRLATMYQVRDGTPAEEAEATAYLVSAVAERLRRLTAAYGEWEQFDAPAYFDLPLLQTNQLVKVVERVRTVHVTFFIDPLLPTFCRATDFWAETFTPAYAQMEQAAYNTERFYRQIQPTMMDHWRQLITVIRRARTILAEDVNFLATNGAQEERTRWRQWWRRPPVTGLDTLLTPPLAEIPTLTLTFDFALPAYRQPGRLRRLQRNQARRRRLKNMPR